MVGPVKHKNWFKELKVIAPLLVYNLHYLQRLCVLKTKIRKWNINTPCIGRTEKKLRSSSVKEGY